SEMPLYVAWREVFEAHGCEPLTIQEWGAGIGTIDGIDEVAMLLERATVPVDVEAVQAARRARVQELMAHEAMRPGVQEWIETARSAGLTCAVASSSSPEWVEPMLDELGLADAFTYVSCARGDVPPKPAP